MFNQKNILLIAGIIGSFSQIADASSLTRDEILEQNKAYLEKMGINLLDGEVRIVNAKSLINQAKDDYYASKVKNFLNMHKEQEKNGFVREPEPRAKELLNFKETAKYQFKKYKKEFAPRSTHLRHNISELKMAYTFVGVPDSLMDKNIGVAPYGAYKQTKQGDKADGWDGAVQFFEKKNIGSCEFKEHNLKLAHGGVELIQELVSEEVNGKPTVILTKGNKDTGFLYQVSWYDNNFSREISCASHDFSNVIKNNVVELAKLIEKFQ